MIIYFYSNKKKAGKSLILSAFSLLLSNNKIKNIAIKPIFNNSSKDDINTQSHLNNILGQKTTFKSRSLTDIKSKNAISKLMSEIKNLDKKYKIVLVEVDHELKSNITKEFIDKNTKSIFINEFSTRINTKSINEIKNLNGIIYNKIPKYRSTYIKANIEPKLSKQNLNILAEIPEIRTLSAITVNQIKDYLNGEYIVQTNENTLIENFLIGTPSMDSGKQYYKSQTKPAVIARANRPDIQMAAIYQDVSCLIVTGNSIPADYSIYEAEEREIPIIAVKSNTIETSKNINKILDISNPYHNQKIEKLSELISHQIDIKQLIST
ncbi:MAG: hypothetical protein CL723_00065 [Chloroflexi bacterium]|jgi:BioD-like phosphotransacetylase family protein|nr:hypothetical protein [Chloroflexota bacterium]|tara:strand:+ start:139 stop:1107 length:969 start_codon:yes stop_codon:yes gene_type:complete